MDETYKIINFEEESLNKILNENYSEIYEEITKKDYVLEYDNFFEFRELIYEDNVVGFLTLDTFYLLNLHYV